MSKLSVAVKFFALFTVVGLAGWLLRDDLWGCSTATPERLAATHVGAPNPPQCCYKSVFTPCTYQCVANPNCPINILTKDRCDDATCLSAPQTNVCTKPVRPLTYMGNQCTTTGKAPACQNPPGTAACEVITAGLQVPFNACNVGESLCVTQPPATCG